MKFPHRRVVPDSILELEKNVKYVIFAISL